MKLLLTTSRKTSQRVRQFIKEFSLIFPKSSIQKSNRGKKSLSGLFEQSSTRYDRIILITNNHGNPKKIIGFYKKDNTFLWCFEFKIQSVKLSYELNVSSGFNPEKTYFNFENIDKELENRLHFFFGPFTQSTQGDDNLSVLNIILKHQGQGFQFYVENENQEKISPEIVINEIVIEDQDITEGI